MNNETLWKQKSREVWLKEGDKNSKFFHLSTIIWRRRNAIDAIKADDGEWITCKDEIRNHIVSKFQALYTSKLVSFSLELDDLIWPSVSHFTNNFLCQIPNPFEIKEAMFGMQNLKSPGPDGLPPLFYKQYWPIVGSSVIKAVQNFFISGQMLSEVNQSLIVLIPKVQSPTNVNHFLPISLCNTVYKIISKILVSRLRLLLSNLISPCQSTFVPDRWIAENQLVVHELLHSFKKRKVKGGFVAMKVDLQKAYDRVNWDFLKAVLLKFGFSRIFVNWILQCVSSVSFSILVNGGKSKLFWPSRGLRQRDPLSPYLFILCQNVLSRIIEKQRLAGCISGVGMNRTVQLLLMLCTPMT